MVSMKREYVGSARGCRLTADPESELIEMAPGGPFFMITRLICVLLVGSEPAQGRKKCQDNYNNRLFLMT